MNSGTQHVACVAIGCFAACTFIKQDTRILFELSVLYIDKTKLNGNRFLNLHLKVHNTQAAFFTYERIASIRTLHMVSNTAQFQD